MNRFTLNPAETDFHIINFIKLKALYQTTFLLVLLMWGT